jgi:Ca-activated chloride channel family protein
MNKESYTMCTKGLRKRWGDLYLFAFISILIITGCSSPSIPKKPKQLTVATTASYMIKEGPGKYAGDRYNESQLTKELQKQPKLTDANQVYGRLVQHLAEDYEPVIKKTNDFHPKTKLTKLGVLDPNIDTQIKKPNKAKSRNIVILIDSSGSMAGQVKGHIKMDEAKKAVSEFAMSLKHDTNTKISILAYGHKGTNKGRDKALSCNSLEVIYPLSGYQVSVFDHALNQLKPAGWTPLAAAIQSAGQKLSTFKGAENVVYVVSDGLESCGGNPIKAAETLHKSNIQTIVNVIGFDLDENSKEQLEQVAKEGGGKFVHASDSESIKKGLSPLDTLFQSNQIIWWKSRNDQTIVWAKIDDEKHIDWVIGKGGFYSTSEFKGQLAKETKRLQTAASTLLENKVISLTIYNELEKLLQNRNNLLKQYGNNLYQNKREEIKLYYQNLQNRMDDIEKIATEQLSS